MPIVNFQLCDIMEFTNELRRSLPSDPEHRAEAQIAIDAAAAALGQAYAVLRWQGPISEHKRPANDNPRLRHIALVTELLLDDQLELVYQLVTQLLQAAIERKRRARELAEDPEDPLPGDIS